MAEHSIWYLSMVSLPVPETAAIRRTVILCQTAIANGSHLTVAVTPVVPVAGVAVVAGVDADAGVVADADAGVAVAVVADVGAAVVAGAAVEGAQVAVTVIIPTVADPVIITAQVARTTSVVPITIIRLHGVGTIKETSRRASIIPFPGSAVPSGRINGRVNASHIPLPAVVVAAVADVITIIRAPVAAMNGRTASPVTMV